MKCLFAYWYNSLHINRIFSSLTWTEGDRDVFHMQMMFLIDHCHQYIGNPLGTPPGVLEAVCRALPQLHRYSDPYCRRLVQAIAAHEQVPASYVLCGNGAADLIYAYCAALRPRTAVEPAPTFAEYGLGLAQVGCRVTPYFLHQAENFDVDEGFLPFLEEKKPEAVFLCTPNNPTGRLLPLPLLEWILQGCAAWGARVFLDECFLDLTEDGVSAKALLAAHPELLILKAFTKSYGMAGIRLGYCLCADSVLLHRMASASQPWNVSSLAQSAGVAALTEQDFLQRTRTLVHTERRWLTDNLTALGFWVCPSQANYLLFRGPRGLREGLLRQGIAIRGCGNYSGLDDGWYRIAVRPHEENEALITAIRQFCKEKSLWL